jgi:hypothetical protein
LRKVFGRGLVNVDMDMDVDLDMDMDMDVVLDVKIITSLLK